MADEQIHLPPETNYSNAGQPVKRMIDEIARLTGGPDDPEALAIAASSVDRSADWLNLMGVYLHARKVHSWPTADDGGVFTSGQQSLTVPADWGWAEVGGLVYGPTGKVQGTLEWLDWELFAAARVSTTASYPEFLSFQGDQFTTIYVYPYIDPDKISTIQIPYFARIARPSEVSEFIAPREIQEALLCGGEAFFMRHRHSAAPPRWKPYWDMFILATQGAKAAAWRQRQAIHTYARPDEAGRLALPSQGVVRIEV